MTTKEVTPSDVVPGAPGVPYFTPEQPVAAGTFHSWEDGSDKPPPTIFKPLKVGPLTLQNRIGVSPMCMYSAASDAKATPFHLIHYGALATRGPGITFVESTAVSSDGRLSYNDLGIWNDEQAESLKPIVDYAHTQKQFIGIQLGHGGRKSNGQPIYLHLEQAAENNGKLEDVKAPSAIPFRPYGNLPTPKELTKEEIKKIIEDFGDAAKRAVEISGFDAISIHSAHGYLNNEFLSKISNKRTDEYGGSFENRIRFLSEVIDNVKSKIDTKKVAIFVRISAQENSTDPDSWNIEDSKKLADLFIEKGINAVTTSSGGNDYRQPPRSGIKHTEPIHVPLARELKKHVGDKLLVSCVGGLDENVEQTTEFIQNDTFDLALIGRGFLKNPGLVWSGFADKLGVRLYEALQLGWGYWPNKQQITDLIQRTEKEASKEKA
ncbi:OYE32 [Candida pseudojiufengensis]|uniref:OYE32 n=1 Tax=Candida pseudojiufengensis TaxID=497109 RepID=UPI00222408A4|nr:OYE32 [Candida pseudojiufengensis]KAI5965340.1 OYE32 [Candida pseudojiufengensis]